MKPTGPLKHFAFAFIIALVLYVVSYNWIENRRTRKGPWEVTFTQENGVPTLIVNQPKLNLTGVRLTFPGKTALATNLLMRFSVPQEVPFEVPFGQCIFEDTTFQPGTIVFNLFDHEIQLIPRVLSIDRREYAWESGSTRAVTNEGMTKVLAR